MVLCCKPCLPLNISFTKTHKSSALAFPKHFPCFDSTHRCLAGPAYRDLQVDRGTSTVVNVFKKLQGREGASTLQERKLRTRGVTQLSNIMPLACERADT